MKKIAISTLIGEINNGNRLQNYALQRLLEDNFEDVEVVTIKNNPYLIRERELSKRYKFFRKLYHILNVKKCKSEVLARKRKKHFQEFNSNIKFDNTIYNKTDLRDLNDKYDYFVCGSDQVWSGEMSPNLATHLLEGIDNNKKISYAASLGKNIIYDYEEELYKKYLPSFKAISVREKSSIDLIKKYNSSVDAHLDPTFMLSALEWEKVMNPPKSLSKKKYVFVCLLGELQKEFKIYLDTISKKYKLKIINIMDKKSKFYTKTGPAEFLYLIKNSEVVFADSFHAIVFSIIFKRPFVHVPRKDASFSNMLSRIKNLEEIFETSFKNFDANNLIFDNSIFEFCVNGSEKIIEREKNRSLKFLKEALVDVKPKNNLYDTVIDCSGCGLCAKLCPTNAISYSKNELGFIMPVIDEKKCIHCGKCKNNCSELVKRKPLDFVYGIYAIKRKQGIDDKASSTGFFGIVAEKIIEEGGVVFGAKYSKTQAKFDFATTRKELETLKGSKYYQFDVTGIYDEVENFLKQGKKVLVCGTPCQISGIRSKFKNNKNLLLMQVICHGVPSFNLFKKIMKEEYKKIPDNVNFRKKVPNWYKFSVEYNFGNESIVIPNEKDLFMRAFLSNKFLNESCYNCKYAGKLTGADLIIGDSWNIKQINKDFFDDKGVSMIVPLSKLGEKALKQAFENVEGWVIPKNKYSACNINIFKPLEHTALLKKHYEFISESNRMSIKEFISKDNQNLTFRQKVKRNIKKVLKRMLKI